MSAKEVAPVSAGFIGSLADTPLAEVLRRLVQEERSGDLQVTIPDAIKTIYFDRGFVVFAASNLKNDRLGESMIEAGRISRSEFAMATLLMKTTGQKFGRVLVQSGVVSEEELGHDVATQVNRIVLSLFSAKRGMYSFDERKTVIPLDLMVSLSVYRILMEGIRRMSSKRLVLAGLPPLDTEVKVVDRPPFSVDLDKLRAVEKAVLRHARDGASLARIAEAIGGNDGVVLRACYGLLCGGILEAVAADGASRRPLRVQEETGTFVLSEIRTRAGAEEESRKHAAPVLTATAHARVLPRQAPEPVSEPRGPTASEFSPRRAPIPEPEATRPRTTVLDWLRGVWETIRKWLTGSAPAEPLGESTAERDVVPAPLVPRAKDPPSLAVEPVEPRPPRASPVDSVGVPPWSLRDEPRSEEAPLDLTVGVPSWSMRDDTSTTFAESSEDLRDQSNQEPPRIESVGVPSWSMRDGPDEQKPPRAPARPVPRERRSGPDDEVRPPSWSILDPPRRPAPAILDKPDSPVSEMDTDLFIEEELTGEEELSMLHHIPVEEVEVVEEGVELLIEVEEPVSESEPEIEEPSEVPTGLEPPTVARKPVLEPRWESESEEVRATGPEVMARPAPVRKRQSVPETRVPATNETTEPESAVEHREIDREQAMLRMKQSGGESRLLRDVKLHFKLRDWEGAVPLLEQLVAISPGKALYRGMLARAMSRHPVRRKEAEEHFIEALRLSPQDAEIHYWLGLYYKSFGLGSRALTEFRTTLRINPNHKGAREQLSASGKKDDALGSVIKKLFG